MGRGFAASPACGPSSTGGPSRFAPPKGVALAVLLETKLVNSPVAPALPNPYSPLITMSGTTVTEKLSEALDGPLFTDPPEIVVVPSNCQEMLVRS